MSIRTKLAGVSFDNNDGTSRQAILSRLNPGDALMLRDGATSDHPESIAVYNCPNFELCGYLSAAMAKRIRSEYANYEDLDVSVLEVTGGSDGVLLGCNIAIHNEDYDAAAEFAPPTFESGRTVTLPPNPPLHSTYVTPRPAQKKLLVPGILLCCLAFYLFYCLCRALFVSVDFSSALKLFLGMMLSSVVGIAFCLSAPK